MVSAPASRPASVSCLRSRRTSSTVCGGVAPGLEAGARDRRLERGLALEAVAGHQPADPALGDPVGAGYLGLGLAGENSGDDKATLRHPAACASPAMPKTCDTPFRCRETPHSDVLNQHTAPATKEVQVRGSARTNRTRPLSFMWAECGRTPSADAVKTCVRRENSRGCLRNLTDAGGRAPRFGGIWAPGGLVAPSRGRRRGAPRCHR